MNEVPKSMIGVSGKLFVNSMLLSHGIPCVLGKNGYDLVVELLRPKRNWKILVTTSQASEMLSARKKIHAKHTMQNVRSCLASLGTRSL